LNTLAWDKKTKKLGKREEKGGEVGDGRQGKRGRDDEREREGKNNKVRCFPRV